MGALAGNFERCQPEDDVANVAELVDALDLGSSGVTRGSSSLPFRTTWRFPASLEPGKSIRRRDDREEIWIHKGFSDGAQYRAVLPTEENSLWIQGSSEGVSPNGLSGLNGTSPGRVNRCKFL